MVPVALNLPFFKKGHLQAPGRLLCCYRVRAGPASTRSTAFVLAGKSDLGGTKFQPGSGGRAGTRTWPFLPGDGAAPQERRLLLTLPEVGSVPWAGDRRQLLVFLGVVPPPLRSTPVFCQLCRGQFLQGRSLGQGHLGKLCPPHVAWLWLRAPVTPAAPGQTCMNPVHIQWFFSPCYRCVLPLKLGILPQGKGSCFLTSVLFQLPCSRGNCLWGRERVGEPLWSSGLGRGHLFLCSCNSRIKRERTCLQIVVTSTSMC